MDSFPIIAQVKSIIQLLYGQTSRALETQMNFIDVTPVLSQLKSLIELLAKGSEKAKNTQIKFISHLNALIDGIPIIGHIKSLLTYIINVKYRKVKDPNKQNLHILAFKRATRTTLVILGGYFAATIALPLGATLNITTLASSIGSILGGLSFDHFMFYNKISCSGHYGHELSYLGATDDIGLKFDKLMGYILDGIIGAHIGYNYYNMNAVSIGTTNINTTTTINTLPPPPKIPVIPSSLVNKYPVLNNIKHIPLPPPVNPLKNPVVGLNYGVNTSVIQRWTNHKEMYAKYKLQSKSAMYKELLFKNESDVPNFGGSMVLAVKNYKNNANTKFTSYEDLGFDILGTDHPAYDESLVKLVRDKDVTIHSCKTETIGGDPFRTELDIENNSEYKVDCLIPAGSVVAEQNVPRGVQNLCARRDFRVILEPKQRNIFNVMSFCMDSDFGLPKGENANFTPLIYRDMPPDLNQSAFWEWSNQFRDLGVVLKV